MSRDIFKKLRPTAADKIILMKAMNEAAEDSARFMVRGSLALAAVGVVFLDPAFIAFNGLAAGANTLVHRFNRQHATHWRSLPKSHVLPEGFCRTRLKWVALRMVAPLLITTAGAQASMATLPEPEPPPATATTTPPAP